MKMVPTSATEIVTLNEASRDGKGETRKAPAGMDNADLSHAAVGAGLYSTTQSSRERLCL